MEANPETSAIRIDGLSVHYPFSERPAFGPIDLAVRRGERILLLGPSGCGKSSLLLALTGLVPASIPARVEGAIRLFGEPVGAHPPAGWAARVAQFFQDADQTLCGMRVEDEIAFGLENFGLAEAEIHDRITETMAEIGLPENWRGRPSARLSGGERQMVALAATMALEPDILLADEPTAHLAPAVAERLYGLLADNGAGRTTIVVDHRFEGSLDRIDRVVVLDHAGQMRAAAAPAAVFDESFALFEAEGVWLPPAVRLARRLGLSVNAGLGGVAALLAGLRDTPFNRRCVSAFAEESLPPPGGKPGGVVVRLDEAACAPFLAKPVLHAVNLSICAGEIVGLIGPNGAGKTTLGATLTGLLPLAAGKRHGPPGAIAFQKPEAQFQSGSVSDELSRYVPPGLAGAERGALISRTLSDWALDGLERYHPFELSIGQKRRLAIAALTLARRWPLIVLDEPTAGLDAHGFATLTRCLDRLRAEGPALVVITHDADAAARLCDRVALVERGSVSPLRPAQEAFRDSDWLARAGMNQPSVMPVLHFLQHMAASC